jgi:hypothetical protein
MNEYNVTPDDLEFVDVRELAIGDVLVDFTPIGKSVAIPATQRQLNMKRTRYNVINTITSAVTVRGHDILEFNIDDAPNRVTVALNLNVRTWRIKREGN